MISRCKTIRTGASGDDRPRGHGQGGGLSLHRRRSLRQALLGTAVLGALALGAAPPAAADVIDYSGVGTTYTILTTGLYDITAFGAQGGASTVGGSQPTGSGGLGARSAACSI